MADWLSYRYRLSGSTARAWVKAAHALAVMPKLAAVYEAGRVSFDQLVMVLSFAKPEQDAELAELLLEIGAVATAAIAKQRRRITARERDHIGLCWHHHPLLHEGGWEATGNADRESPSPVPSSAPSAPEPDRSPPDAFHGHIDLDILGTCMESWFGRLG